MIWSIYNHIFKSKSNGFLLYNSRTNCFAEMDEELHDLLSEIKRNPDNFDFKNRKELQKQLIDAKILVKENEDKDFFYEKKFEYYKSAFYSEELSLTIAPTLGCNFNCFYCYENRYENILMDKSTELAILNFIKSFNKIRKLKITWYGGEPLLGFENIVRLTTEIKKLDTKKEMQMVTNAFLLDDEKSAYFGEIGLKDIQVTIDGIEATHNKRRTHKKGYPTYHKILDNIDVFLKYNRNTKVLIRVNVDNKNKNEYHKLFRILNDRWKEENVFIYAAFVRDNHDQCKCSINDPNEEVNFFIDQFMYYGVNNLNFYPRLTLGGCGANGINFYVIDPEGGLYKCWNDIGIESKRIGYLHDKELNRGKISRYIVGPSMYEEEECMTCSMFPVCSGGCSFKRIENKYEGKHNSVCCYGKIALEQFLNIHYEMRTRKKKFKI